MVLLCCASLLLGNEFELRKSEANIRPSDLKVEDIRSYLFNRFHFGISKSSKYHLRERTAQPR